MNKVLVTALIAISAIQPLSAAEARKPLHAHAQPAARWSDRGPSRHAWHRGDIFDSRYAENYQVLYHRAFARLYAPPRGCDWFRADDDAVLVINSTGFIVAVERNVF